MNETTKRILEKVTWADHLQGELLQEFDRCIENSLPRHGAENIVHYVTMKDLAGVAEMVIMSGKFETLWNEHIKVYFKPHVNKVIRSLRSYPYYKYFSDYMKRQLKEKITYRLLSNRECAIDLSSFDTEIEGTVDDFISFCTKLGFWGEALDNAVHRYKTVDYISPYKEGDIVSILDTEGTYKIVEIVHMHDHYEYVGYKFNDEWRISFDENIIIDYAESEDTATQYSEGDYVKQATTGIIVKIKAIHYDTYPFMYRTSYSHREWVKGDLVPAYVVATCAHCGTIVDTRETHMTEVEDGVFVCPTCLDMNYNTCTDCGTLYRKGTSRSNHQCSMCYARTHSLCAYCGKGIDDQPKVVYKGMEFCGMNCLNAYIKDHYRPFIGYTTKPTPIFFGDVREGYGVELEVDTNGVGDLRLTQDIKSKELYFKRDGSLRNGVEIITHPASLEYHQKDMPWLTITKACKRYGYTSYSIGTCGVHVHASRSMLGDSSQEREYTIAKLLLFFDQNWDKITIFSRRKQYEIDRWSPRPNSTITPNDKQEDYSCKIAHKMVHHDQRYTAINLTNEHTIEFRVFRGSTNAWIILANIEFCDSLINWIKGISLVDMATGTWEKWADQIDSKKYPNMVRLLNKKQLTKVVK